jgi:hypothetical protein
MGLVMINEVHFVSKKKKKKKKRQFVHICNHAEL